MNEYMKETNEALLHTYNQFPVVLERGEGAYLYDTEGKKISGLCGRICSVFAGIC